MEDYLASGLDLLGAVRDFLTTVSSIVTMVLMAGTVYFGMKYSEFMTKEKKEIKEKFSRRKTVIHEEAIGKPARQDWARIEEYMRSQNPSDWKVAILEADIMLDDLITSMGYQGETMGDRMKGIVSADFPYLDYAWEAHKFRNDLAHETGRPLVRHEADRIIGLYERVFKEMKVI